MNEPAGQRSVTSSAGHQLGRDAVAGEIEKSGAARGCTQVREEPDALVAAAIEAADVEDGKARHHAGPPLVAPATAFSRPDFTS